MGNLYFDEINRSKSSNLVSGFFVNKTSFEMILNKKPYFDLEALIEFILTKYYYLKISIKV